MEPVQRAITYYSPMLTRFERPKEARYSPIVIIGLWANPVGDDVQPQGGEFVMLENLCQTAMSLDGWRIGYGEPLDVLGVLDVVPMKELPELVRSPQLSAKVLKDRFQERPRSGGKANTQSTQASSRSLVKGTALVLPFGTMIAPNRRLKVHTGPGKPTVDAIFCHRRKAVWNNAGGKARLYDATGALLQTFSYGDSV